MRLELVNIGKIDHADIELNGITVVAGENNTGKSTIGKMLYCVFSAFYMIEDQVHDERVSAVNRALFSYYHETTGRARRITFQKLAEKIVDNKDIYLKDIPMLKREIEDFYIGNKDLNFQQYMNVGSAEALVGRICPFLKLTDDEIQKRILTQRLDAEFGMNVGHLNKMMKKSEVRLNIKNGSIDFEMLNNKDVNINSYMNLNKEIIYIDDPFILDDLRDSWQYYSLRNKYEHREALLGKLEQKRDADDFSAVDEIVIGRKLKKIFSLMNDVCDGMLVIADSGNCVYKTERLAGDLEMVNLSTGMKSFVILRTLLQNGSIGENDTIILDEPEIHLHPEWQLKFAEIIVLIQKEFGANILLNTHSPYFLNAIEVYSAKYGINDKCKYYLVDETLQGTLIDDVTNETERIYAKLAKPLQKLENLEYDYGCSD